MSSIQVLGISNTIVDVLTSSLSVVLKIRVSVVRKAEQARRQPGELET